jgi:hypothetical protein
VIFLSRTGGTPHGIRDTLHCYRHGLETVSDFGTPFEIMFNEICFRLTLHLDCVVDVAIAIF